MPPPTDPLTAAELDEGHELADRARLFWSDKTAPAFHAFWTPPRILRLVAMARRGAEIEKIALEFRDTATDTYSVVCALGESKPCRYHKCDYHNMRDAEAQFDAALAEVNGTPTQEAPNDGS